MKKIVNISSKARKITSAVLLVGFVFLTFSSLLPSNSCNAMCSIEMSADNHGCEIEPLQKVNDCCCDMGNSKNISTISSGEACVDVVDCNIISITEDEISIVIPNKIIDNLELAEVNGSGFNITSNIIRKNVSHALPNLEKSSQIYKTVSSFLI